MKLTVNQPQYIVGENSALIHRNCLKDVDDQLSCTKELMYNNKTGEKQYTDYKSGNYSFTTNTNDKRV